MIRYLLKRLFSGLLLLFIYASLLFFAIQIILPGDFVSHFALGLTNAQSEELRIALNLDLPLWERYFIWVTDLLRGDLGYAFTAFGVGQPVIEVIKNTLPITLLVFGIGTTLAFILGQWLGRVAAWRGPGAVSGMITFTSIGFYTSFPPWFAFLVVHFLAWRLGVPLRLGARVTFRTPGTSEAIIITQMLVGLVLALLLAYLLSFLWRSWRRRPLPGWLIFILTAAGWVLSWTILGISTESLEILRLAALPILIYSALSFGEVMLIMRTAMVDTLDEDYIQTARAKGLPDKVIRDRHAARNALLPVLSRLVISIPFMLAGMAMIEEAINVDGLGTALFYAVGVQSITLVMGAVLFIGVISLFARLVLDILQFALDPRVRSGAGG